MTSLHVFSLYSGPKKQLLISFILAFFLSSSLAQAFDCPGGEGQIKASECLALQQIYDAISGPNWRDVWDRPVWVYGPHCSGEVGCDPSISDRHVTVLNLTYKGMVGELPNDAFTKLPYLHTLYIISLNGEGDIHGSIPPAIADLKYLYNLQIKQTNISGTIPEGLLGNDASPFWPSETVQFELNDNKLTGTLPKVVGRNINGGRFYVSNNPDLGGQIPSEYIQEHPQIGKFYLNDTKICEPQDNAMQHWLHNIYDYQPSGSSCDQGPDKPADLTASSGTSDINVILQWTSSNSATEYYVVERSINGSNWAKLASVQWKADHSVEYYDKTAETLRLYHYRVKACGDDNQCSAHSNTAKGYKNLAPPTSLTTKIVPYQDTALRIVYFWLPTVGFANEYRYYVAKEHGYMTSVKSDNFKNFARSEVGGWWYHEQSLNDKTFIELTKNAIAVKACGDVYDDRWDDVDFSCSDYFLLNRNGPPGLPAIINILTNGK